MHPNVHLGTILHCGFVGFGSSRFSFSWELVLGLFSFREEASRKVNIHRNVFILLLFASVLAFVYNLQFEYYEYKISVFLMTVWKIVCWDEDRDKQSWTPGAGFTNRRRLCELTAAILTSDLTTRGFL